MKKLLFSIAAVTMLSAAFILTYWAINEPDKTQEHGSSETSWADNSTTEISKEEQVSAEITNSKDEITLGPLFSPVKSLIDEDVYKLETVRQKRFGGNSVPVKTTTYYGNGFVNVIEEEGHGISTETFIDNSGIYCFDSTSGTIYLMTSLPFALDAIPVDGLVYLETGTATVGNATMTYERYKTEEGAIIDYLFAGNEIKKMKIYGNDDYELISVEVSPDISSARTHIPDNAIIVNNG